MAKWLTRWSAKPVFEGSIPSRCSNQTISCFQVVLAGISFNVPIDFVPIDLTCTFQVALLPAQQAYLPTTVTTDDSGPLHPDAPS